MVEYLSTMFYNYGNFLCYGTGILFLLVMYAVFKNGGLKKPKKEDVWGWVKVLLDKWEGRDDNDRLR